MNGEVPEIYWYLFWVGLAIVMEAFGFFMATIIHRRNMRVLDLLKSYADKGIEPPAAVAELLSEQVKDPDRAWKSSPRGARLERFTGFLFTACVIGGVAWWLVELRRAGLGGLSGGVRRRCSSRSVPWGSCSRPSFRLSTR
jgi:hypothetical protein